MQAQWGSFMRIGTSSTPCDFIDAVRFQLTVKKRFAAWYKAARVEIHANFFRI
jgi:hypothetical protein